MKPLLTIAGILLLIGIVFCGGAIFINGGLSFEKSYSTKTISVEEPFSSFFIDVDTTNISILPTNDEKCTLTIYEKERLPHTVSAENGTLTVKAAEKKWYDHIQLFDFSTPKITINLPLNEYKKLAIVCGTGDVDVAKDFIFDTVDINLSTGDVKFCASVKNLISIHGSTGSTTLENANVGSIDLSRSTGNTILNKVQCEGAIRIKSNTGDTTIHQMNAQSLYVTASTGKVDMNRVSCADTIDITTSTGKSTLSAIRCKNLISESGTGDLNMTDVIATVKFTLECSTGNIRFDRCDAAEILAETSTGSVKGTLLTDKVFIAQTNTGTKKVPESTSGGKCKITTDTGDIVITIVT